MTIEARYYTWHLKLWCSFGAITFPDSQTVALHLQEGECCDMHGAIIFAKQITRDLDGFDLRFVRTFSGAIPSTVYELGKDWRASR